MFKVTFAFENGSTVEAFANAGIIYWRLLVVPMWLSMHHVPETEPVENVGYS